MYKSPIDIIYGQMETQLEGTVMKAVQKVGVNVDKDELIRALQYDRGQYKKGYADAMESIVHCKDCKHFDRLFKGEGVVNKIGTCRLREEEELQTAQSCDDFCSYGERKDNA